MTLAANSPTSSAGKRVIVRSRSELARGRGFGSSKYYEEASISFPMGQRVQHCFDHSDYRFPMGVTLDAKRQVRKRNWKPYGDGRWYFKLPFSPYTALYWIQPCSCGEMSKAQCDEIAS